VAITTLPRTSAVSVAGRAARVRPSSLTRTSHPPWMARLSAWVHRRWVAHLVPLLSVLARLDLDPVSLANNSAGLQARTLCLQASAPHRVHMPLQWAPNSLPTTACQLPASTAVPRLPFRLLGRVQRHPAPELPTEASMLRPIRSRSLVPASGLSRSTTTAAIPRLERTNHRRRVAFGVMRPSWSEHRRQAKKAFLLAAALANHSTFRCILARLGVTFFTLLVLGNSSSFGSAGHARFDGS